MSLNVLMVGGGGGSWQIRGVQLGAAIGARVTTSPSPDDWRWADVAVLVKRTGARFAPEAHAAGVPIVWDALDFWRQPAENQADETRANELLQARIQAIKPTLVVCATQAMADACGGTYLPHHRWAGLEPTPAREHVKTVAYEGTPKYLGRWRQKLEHACEAKGWEFVINPSDLRSADIIVALRDAQWDGWICREWKSGVKLANAIAAGRPVITQASAAFRELQPVGALLDGPNGIAAALDWFTPLNRRHVAAVQVQARSMNIHQVAARYLSQLDLVYRWAA